MTLPSFGRSATLRTPQCHWNPRVQMAHIALRAEVSFPLSGISHGAWALLCNLEISKPQHLGLGESLFWAKHCAECV